MVCISLYETVGDNPKASKMLFGTSLILTWNLSGGLYNNSNFFVFQNVIRLKEHLNKLEDDIWKQLLKTILLFQCNIAGITFVLIIFFFNYFLIANKKSDRIQVILLGYEKKDDKIFQKVS